MSSPKTSNKKHLKEDSSKVYISKFNGYDDSSLNGFVRDLLYASKIDFKNKRILLKPNLLLAKPADRAVTTHPAVLEAVILALKEQNAKVFVGDSSGMPVSMQSIAATTGLLSVIKKHGAEFVDFNRHPITLSRKDNRLVKSFTLARIVNEVDLIINLPKLKTHVQAVYSGALKNMFGCIPGLLKPQFHFKFPDSERFARMIVDLNHIVMPSFTILDGIVAMEGQGPSNGSPYPLGLLIASKDPVAVDALACNMIHLDPYDVPILRMAGEDHLGILDVSKLNVISDVPLSSLRAPSFRLMKKNTAMRMGPSAIQGFLRQYAVSRPVIDSKKCIKCHICVSVCPADALHKGAAGNAPEFEYSKCIRCYCCHEMCPEGAIHKKGTWLSYIFEKFMA